MEVPKVRMLSGLVVMVRMGFGHCVVIVAVIVTAEPLVANVAENQECRASHCYAAFPREVQ